MKAVSISPLLSPSAQTDISSVQSSFCGMCCTTKLNPPCNLQDLKGYHSTASVESMPGRIRAVLLAQSGPTLNHAGGYNVMPDLCVYIHTHITETAYFRKWLKRSAAPRSGIRELSSESCKATLVSKNKNKDLKMSNNRCPFIKATLILETFFVCQCSKRVTLS